MKVGSNSEVVIGGAGIAAAAMAVRLCTLGFQPRLLARAMPIVSGAEAIPEAAMALFAELGLDHALRDAGATSLVGFENHWNPLRPIVHRGRWIHVDRSRLASATVEEAVRRGAIFETCNALPRLSNDRTHPATLHSGDFAAVVDATGRSAIWSRPVRREGNNVADLFRQPTGALLRGKVVRTERGWAYRIGLGSWVTIATIADSSARRCEPDSNTCHALGIAPENLQSSGRRPAFPQWSENPVSGNRLAIGDAALAYDPVAGQGICFALSSAWAAAAVIHSWQEKPHQRAIAERFYCDFVARARRRHLEHRRRMFEPFVPADERVSMPETVRFSGRSDRAALQVDGEIIDGEVLVVPNDNRVRWVNGVDLLEVRHLTRSPITMARLVRELRSNNHAEPTVVAALRWCLRNGVIAAAHREAGYPSAISPVVAE